MKKLLLLCLTVLFCVGWANAKSYTIAFKAESDGNSIGSNQVMEQVVEGADFVTSFSTNMTSVFTGNFGIRLQNARLTVNLSDEGQVNATSVVVKARKRQPAMPGMGGDAPATLSVNGGAAQELTDTDNDVDLTFDLDGAKLTSLELKSTETVYVNSITINYPSDYTIEFKAESDGNSIGSNQVMEQVVEGADFVTSFSTNMTSVFTGKFGLRLQNARLTINLSDEGQVNATSIVVKARKRQPAMPGMGGDAPATLSVNGAAAQELTDTDNDVDLTFELNGTKLSSIELKNTETIYVKSITVKEGGAVKKAVELSFDKEKVLAMVGSEFAAPELNCSVEGLEITYSSSDTSVATVDNTGKVTLLAAGETEITARFAGDNEYRAAQASYTLTVVGTINSWTEFTDLDNVRPFKPLTAKINFPCTVTYQTTLNSVRYTYVVANGIPMVIYGNVPDYEVGDVIPAGWIATYDKPAGVQTTYGAVVEEAPEAATEKETFAPTVTKNVTTSTQYNIYEVKDVTFEYGLVPNQYNNIIGTYTQVEGRQQTPNTEVSFRNYFEIETSNVAGIYNVTFIAEKVSGTMYYHPIKFELVEATTGIDSILEEELPAEYYNLDGIHVENPTSGLYIRRQGDKVTKVIIR